MEQFILTTLPYKNGTRTSRSKNSDSYFNQHLKTFIRNSSTLLRENKDQVTLKIVHTQNLKQFMEKTQLTVIIY